MPDTLKPCPFCGYKSIEILKDENEYLYYPFFSQCQMCGAGAKRGRTKQEAIDAWNSRVGHEPAGECAEHNRAERGAWCGEEGEKG